MSQNTNHPQHPLQRTEPTYITCGLELLCRPAISPTIMSCSHAFKEWPGLGEAVSKLRAICEAEAPDNQVTSMLIRNSQLSNDIYELWGSALVICLPAGFEPYLAKLAVQRPSGITQPATVDLLDLEQVYIWSIRDKIGQSWSIEFDINVLTALAGDCCPSSSRNSISFAPVIWFAGETVAAGGFWIDELWGCDMGAMPLCHRVSLFYSDEEIAEASERAKIVGRRPWSRSFWEIKKDQYVVSPYVADLRSKVACNPESEYY